MTGMRRFVIFACVLLCTAVAQADEAGTATREAGKMLHSADLIQSFLALLLVLSIFFSLIWLVRKTGNLGFIPKNQLSVVAGLSLGMREKLVLVKVGEKQLLLGISAGRIDKLLELEGEQRLYQEQDGENQPGLFQKRLMQAMQGKNNV